MGPPSDAIVLRGVTKSFKRSTIRHEYTTLKSELVSWITGRRKKQQTQLIEALRGVDLTIPRGKTVGILGRNGSGKSTLLKLITGIYAPTQGDIQVNGRISALLDLGAGFHPDFSGRENILINGIILGMTRAEVKARMDDIIAFSELGDFIDEPVRTYSSGMYMRLAFSVATHVDPEILIVDEILAVGDSHFSKKSLAKMEEFKEAGKTIVLVTHDLGTVEAWCDLAAWIDGGRIRRVGTPSELVREYRAAVELAEEAGAALTPAALSSDGGALPQVPGMGSEPTPEGGPALQMALLDGQGMGQEALKVGEGGLVELSFACSRPLPAASFRVSVTNAQGLLLWSTRTTAAQLGLADTLEGEGQVCLGLEWVALAPGGYVVRAELTGEGGARVACELPLQLEGAATEEGVVGLPHRWQVAAQQAQGPRLVAGR